MKRRQFSQGDIYLSFAHIIYEYSKFLTCFSFQQDQNFNISFQITKSQSKYHKCSKNVQLELEQQEEPKLLNQNNEMKQAKQSKEQNSTLSNVYNETQQSQIFQMSCQLDELEYAR
ncbi:unnamed protein product [Paramecium octaurelia]|uniref:Uncharacterized protein n=1 Tax=Paramecium octaurelia TaxID=43137 RepID=A0A8S1YQ59_PAROT|nr:unnamed protein product [Paramecium octaurelia]